MKKTTITLFTLFLFVFAFADAAFSQTDNGWERVSPLPQEHNLTTVYVVPESGRIIATGALSTVLISDDDGDSWDMFRNPGGVSSSFSGYGMHFFDENTGFMFGNYGTILNTIDGGISWNIIYQDSTTIGAAIVDMTFVDEINVYAVFNENYQWTLMQSNDACITWDTVQNISGTMFHDIEFINNQVGMALADSRSVHTTLDGGKTWNETILADTISLTMSQVDLTLLNDSTAFICCFSQDNAVVLRSEDFGVTWSTVLQDYRFPGPHNTLFFNDLDGIYLLPTGFGYYVQVFATNDAGVSWEEVPPSTYNLSWVDGAAFSVLDSQRVIAVGQWGAIHISEDRGVTWIPISERMINGDIIDSWFFEDGFCAAITNEGDGGVSFHGIYQSSDSAQNWTRTGISYEFDFKREYLSQDTIFEVLPDYEMILRRTIDGGQSWEEFPVGVYDNYQHNRIKFYDYNNGLILCDWHILKTSDAGETWVDVNSGNQINVRFLDAAYVTPQRVFVIGDDYGAGNSVWRSDDGGDTWNPVTEITGNEYHTIYFSDQYNGFIADYNEILKTDDGGETWSESTIHSDKGITIKDIHFPTPQVGYAVGNGIKVLKTGDGGSNWYPIENEFTSNLTAVHFYDENHGIVMGENGLVLRTDNGGATFIEEQPAIPAEPSAITLFPNPATDILNITFEEPQQRGELIFYNTAGTEVMRRTHNPNVAGIIMNIQTMDAGAYVVHYVVDGNIIETYNLIIQ